MAQDKTDYTESTTVSLEDSPTFNREDEVTKPIIELVRGKFNRAKTARRYDEERWLRAYRNYRGIYGPDIQFREDEKSRVFIKVTKTKVLAAYGAITEVLFSNNSFPISVS